MMNKKIVTIVKYLVLLLVAGALLLLAFRGMDVRKIVQEILHANMFWVTISGLISVIAFVVRAHRWNLLIEPMGYSPSLKNTTFSVMVGYLANYFVPRLGEVSRCGALSKAESIPFNKLFGTVVVERIIDVISLLVCIILAAVLEYKRLGNFFNENIFDPIFSKFQQLANSPLMLSIVILLLVSLLVTAFYFTKKSREKERGSKLTRILQGFTDGL